VRQPLSTNPSGIAQRCPTQRIRIRLPLATIEELDHLASLYHLTRQEILRRILAAALTSDTPFALADPDGIRAHAALTRVRSVELAGSRP
jgi:hypothetical protein